MLCHRLRRWHNITSTLNDGVLDSLVEQIGPGAVLTAGKRGKSAKWRVQRSGKPGNSSGE